MRTIAIRRYYSSRNGPVLSERSGYSRWLLAGVPLLYFAYEAGHFAGREGSDSSFFEFLVGSSGKRDMKKLQYKEPVYASLTDMKKVCSL